MSINLLLYEFKIVALSAATLGLLATIKTILDKLSIFGSAYSTIGSNTTNPFVDTWYAYSSGFWLVLVTFLISLLLLPLFFIVSHQAKSYRLERSSGFTDDYYSNDASSFSFNSVDAGPRLPPKGSKEPLDFNASHNPTVQYVKETTSKIGTYDPGSAGVSYQYPPMSQQDAGPQRFVRFDGSQSIVSTGPAAQSGPGASSVTTTTKKTVVTKEVIQE